MSPHCDIVVDEFIQEPDGRIIKQVDGLQTTAFVHPSKLRRLQMVDVSRFDENLVVNGEVEASKQVNFLDRAAEIVLPIAVFCDDLNLRRAYLVALLATHNFFSLR
jgi:hypothetical protein